MQVPSRSSCLLAALNTWPMRATLVSRSAERMLCAMLAGAAMIASEMGSLSEIESRAMANRRRSVSSEKANFTELASFVGVPLMVAAHMAAPAGAVPRQMAAQNCSVASDIVPVGSPSAQRCAHYA